MGRPRKGVENLAQQRESLGLTQGQMAALIKCSQSHVSKVEGGEDPGEYRNAFLKHYRVSSKRFDYLHSWQLPLWRCAAKTEEPQVEASVVAYAKDCIRRKASRTELEVVLTKILSRVG